MKLNARSFAGGEITPELYARLDLAKHQTGLALARNFLVMPHGPAKNRPGFSFVIETKDSTKKSILIPFSYNTEQTYVIEVGAGYFRFHTNGGTVLEAAKTITGVSIASQTVITSNAHGFSNGDWIYVASISGTVGTVLNNRYLVVSDATANDFKVKDLWGNYISTSGLAYTSGGTASRVLTVTNSYTEAQLPDLHYTQSNDVLTLVHPAHPPAELKRASATSWTFTNISFVPTLATPGAPTLTTGGSGGGTPVNNTYKCTALAADTLEESLASSSATQSYDLTVAGNYIDVDPPSVTGAIRYNIYKLKNGLYGYIGQTDGSALRDNNILPDVSRTPPEASTPFAGAGDYPGAVGYFEGRRVFAGTDNKPQNYWLTRSATESNLSYSIPTRDDDAISGRIMARDANRIRHVVPITSLVLLTAAGEWKLAPQNSDVLTPDSAAPKQDVFEGASNVTPVISGAIVLYVHEAGSRPRELRYKWEANGLDSQDLGVLAPHLFDDYTLTALTLQKAPTRFVWYVRSDGKLLGLTYLNEHQVAAWHQHDTTGGTFEAVASVKEGREYVLYATVKRTVNSRTVRYIERMGTRQWPLLKNAFVVDSGLTYVGPAVTEVSGLWHLEGKTVSLLVDGAVFPQATVTGGKVQLASMDTSAYSSDITVHVGLPITSDLQTLPLAIEGAEGAAQGALKNVNRVFFRVHNSAGIFAGPSFTQLREYAPRTNEAWGSPPGMKSGELELGLDGKWTTSGQICIRQSDPLPLTVLSMTLDCTFEGERG